MAEIVRIANDELIVEVSSLGAEMQSLNTQDGRSWLWNGDAAFWTGRSPILFPIVGKAPDNAVKIGGQSYEMNQHGFARRTEFRVAEHSATSVLHELIASEATKAVYPFDFRLTLRHEISGRTLTVTAEVTNTGDKHLTLGIGFHPGFAWPLPGAEGRDHAITLDNKAEPALVRIDRGLRLPERLTSPFSKGYLKLHHSQYEEDAMIFPDGAGDGLTYAADGGSNLHFTFENLPNLALWTKPGAPFICVEPWHGTAPEIGTSGELMDRPHSISLAAGKSAKFAFGVEILG